MSEVRGGTGARGNPAPRRALSRFSPLEADERGPAPAPTPDDSAHEGAHEGANEGAYEEGSPAAAPGGTQGRDLLIPGRPAGRGKNGRSVPSLADLMPPPAPSGRRKAAQPKHAGRAGGAGHSDKESRGGRKVVALEVPLAKAVRKRLKARAAELGLSPEDAIAQLVQVWLDG